jgi:hypothetical protein
MCSRLGCYRCGSTCESNDWRYSLVSRHVRAPLKRTWRAHPYHGTSGNRCADRRFSRSRPTVGVKVIGSLSAKLCVLFKTCANRRWSKPSSPLRDPELSRPSAIDHSPGCTPLWSWSPSTSSTSSSARSNIQQRTDYYQQSKPFARLFGVTEQILPDDYRASGPIFGACCTDPSLPSIRRHNSLRLLS